ncbi:MAG: BlaI/MecI/CopY family transcriptional regulator [Planctomycetaceae bacterium]|nr:BlaI/MecI/CopY family transcriptional regulator [Planctomycetaceae bacterium]
MNTPNIGRVQMRIMQCLWSRGRANAREITETLSAEEPIAHSTVQTLLRQLEEKNVVAHDAEDRTFVFYPLVKERDYKKGATQELIGRFFDGSPSELFAFLLENETVDSEELAKISAQIKAQSAKCGSQNEK